MEISQLEAFLAVGQIRNFTKAAAHLHISQSAVTARIRTLEAEVGKTLLLRDNRKVVLTEAGMAFWPYAERMVKLYEESRVTLAEQVELRIVLSGPGSVWHYTYMERLLAFRREQPGVAVKLLSYIDSSYMIRDLLLDGLVHIALRYEPPRHPNVSHVFLFEDALVPVSAPSRAAPILRANLFGPGYCHLVWGAPFPEWFADLAGPGYVPALELDHSTIMTTLLLQGAGFGFLPRSIAGPYLDLGQLVELPCELQPPPLRVYAHFLTDNRDQPNVRLGLQLLGADS